VLVVLTPILMQMLARLVLGEMSQLGLTVCCVLCPYLCLLRAG
jgi:hypothetical protein